MKGIFNKMIRACSAILLFLFLTGNLFAKDEAPASIDNQQKKDNTIEYWLFGSIPAVVILWGVGSWGWGTAAKWHFQGDGRGLEQDSYTGGADKLGHLWGIYTVSRIGSYAFERSGDSGNLAAFKGFLFSQLVGLGIEVGDGFGKTYGFGWADMVWNLGGGGIALLMDIYPPLDELIGFQIEYWPSEDHRNQKKAKWLEITSDVSGQKFILSLKLSGVPWVRDTFLQYFQIDFGYYTRGYWYYPSVDRYKTRHTYIGFAFNLSRISGKVMPEGRWRNGFSSFFKYYHPPIAMNPESLDHTLEGKTLILPK